MTKRNLYLIRHGQYHLNRRDEGELTDRGLEQARTTAFALRNVKMHTIYTSPVMRAQQTADIIAEMFPDTPMKLDDRLRECIPDIPRDFEDFFAARFPEITKERMRRCTLNLEEAFETYFMPSETGEIMNNIVVCHGNVIRFFVSRVLQTNGNFWVNMIINHCGISRVSIEADGRMFLVSHNDIGHLTDDLRTEN